MVYNEHSLGLIKDPWVSPCWRSGCWNIGILPLVLLHACKDSIYDTFMTCKLICPPVVECGVFFLSDKVCDHENSSMLPTVNNVPPDNFRHLSNILFMFTSTSICQSELTTLFCIVLTVLSIIEIFQCLHVMLNITYRLDSSIYRVVPCFTFKLFAIKE